MQTRHGKAHENSLQSTYGKTNIVFDIIYLLDGDYLTLIEILRVTLASSVSVCWLSVASHRNSSNSKINKSNQKKKRHISHRSSGNSIFYSFRAVFFSLIFVVSSSLR